jgi:hypothetical protein
MLAVMRHVVFSVLLCASCSRTSVPPAPKDDPTTDPCQDLFAPPPRAEKLCDEHVAAKDSEIAWSSFALGDPLADVTRRYGDTAARCKGATTSTTPWFSVELGDRSVSMHDATAPGYPSCEKKASPSHKTVVVVSKRTSR